MSTWDLSPLYSGLDDPKFTSDMEALEPVLKRITDLSTNEDIADLELLREYVDASVELSTLVSKLVIFANLRYSADTRDVESASAIGRIMSTMTATAGPMAVISAKIASIDGLEELIDGNEDLREYKYMLMNIKNDAKYLLSDKEEAVFAKMNMSGASAWEDLQSSLTSGLKVEYGDETITLSAVRNLAYDPDADVRRRAYEAEIKAYEKIKEAVAFSLNSIKLQTISECELRGFESALAKSLYNSRMKRETLDALMTAIEEYLPDFRKYLLAKAKALGHEGALPWYDLFAPLGELNKTFTIEEARDYLLSVFGKFDKEMHDLVECAFNNRWIDFYPREGKVGGAFDCGIPSIKESRVLTNFDGSFSSVLTLAHELGHSFHDRMVSGHSIINQEYTMPVAETASTFNEVLVMESAIANAESDGERLALLENELMETCQIICDIYSRFKFESSVFENRPNEFMNADRMCELMLAAQDISYGEGLDKDTRHPFMWLCKGHYYSGSFSFYNYPYAFGGLFARGLYAKYQEEGERFVATYKRMLTATSLGDVEDTGLIAGIDLTSPDFWRAGLAGIKKKIDEFVRLVNK